MMELTVEKDGVQMLFLCGFKSLLIDWHNRMMLPKFLLDDTDIKVQCILCITYHTNSTTKIQWALPHSTV